MSIFLNAYRELMLIIIILVGYLCLQRSYVLFLLPGLYIWFNCTVGWWNLESVLMGFFITKMLILQFQSSDRPQMKDIKIMHTFYVRSGLELSGFKKIYMF